MFHGDGYVNGGREFVCYVGFDTPTKDGNTKWYACACCPPNVTRLIGSIGKYAYGEKNDTVYCHLFAAGKADFSNGMSIECTTDYPYGMSVKYKATGIGRLTVRIPKWSRKNLIRINGSDISPTLESDYQYIDVNGMTEVELILDGNPRFVRASGKIPRLTGMAALMRGPLVYCFEGADNGSVRELRIKRSVAPEVHEFEPQLLGGSVKLIASAYRVRDRQEGSSLTRSSTASWRFPSSTRRAMRSLLHGRRKPRSTSRAGAALLLLMV